jgi:hypothetical protein
MAPRVTCQSGPPSRTAETSVHSQSPLIRPLRAAALFGAVLCAGVGAAVNRNADFHFVLSILLLALLFVQHQNQRRNNQAIEKKLDE